MTDFPEDCIEEGNGSPFISSYIELDEVGVIQGRDVEIGQTNPQVRGIMDNARSNLNSLYEQFRFATFVRIVEHIKDSILDFVRKIFHRDEVKWIELQPLLQEEKEKGPLEFPFGLIDRLEDMDPSIRTNLAIITTKRFAMDQGRTEFGNVIQVFGNMQVGEVCMREADVSEMLNTLKPLQYYLDAEELCELKDEAIESYVAAVKEPLSLMGIFVEHTVNEANIVTIAITKHFDF